eukprot:3155429-Rhodomonas_salina.1
MVGCTVPARGVGNVTFSVVLPGGASSGLPFEYSSILTIASILPSRGPMVGGSYVTVLVGGDLSLYSDFECSFGSLRVSGVMHSSTTVTCISPFQDGPGVLPFSLFVDDLQTSISVFEFVLIPSVVRILPSSGSLMGGTTVSIFGAEFSAPGLQCKFGRQIVAGSNTEVISSSL